MALAVRAAGSYDRLYDPTRYVTTGTSGTEQPADRVIIINVATAYALTLLPRPWQGRRLTIKDGSGAAATYNITIGVTDGTLIDGAATLVLNNNYASVDLCFSGLNWCIL